MTPKPKAPKPQCAWVDRETGKVCLELSEGVSGVYNRPDLCKKHREAYYFARRALTRKQGTRKR